MVVRMAPWNGTKRTIPHYLIPNCYHSNSSPFPFTAHLRRFVLFPKRGAISGKTQAMWLSYHLFSTSGAILYLQKITSLQKRLLMDTRHKMAKKLVIASPPNHAK